MLRALLKVLLKLSHPYRRGHLYHADGSLYMGRYTLFETRYLSARLHHIATEDRDRAMHDHPWTFLALMLGGGYAEVRPADPLHPTFQEGVEVGYCSTRHAGSVAVRRATDRHRITAVLPDTWTLFIYGPMRQWWGFFTPAGKIYWRDFPAVIANEYLAQEKVTP